MRVLLAQQRCEKGDLAGNLAGVRLTLARARAWQADAAMFPEMNLGGYVIPQERPELVWERNSPPLTDFLACTRGFAGVVSAGFIESNPAGKPFITQIIARAGETLGFVRKRNIADEETLSFSPGEAAPFVFPCGGVRCGVAICADIAERQVFAGLAAAGAQLVVEVAAPGLYGAQETRNWQSGYAWWEGECLSKLGAYARELGLWIGAATQAGRTCDEDFPGGGYLFAPSGERLAATRGPEPCLLVCEIDPAAGQARLLAEESWPAGGEELA